jgi:hypothetical protein
VYAVKVRKRIKAPKNRFMQFELVCKYTTVDKFSIINQTANQIINNFGAC